LEESYSNQQEDLDQGSYKASGGVFAVGLRSRTKTGKPSTRTEDLPLRNQEKKYFPSKSGHGGEGGGLEPIGGGLIRSSLTISQDEFSDTIFLGTSIGTLEGEGGAGKTQRVQYQACHGVAPKGRNKKINNHSGEHSDQKRRHIKKREKVEKKNGHM